VFFFAKYIPEYGQKRPIHVGGLHYDCIILYVTVHWFNSLNAELNPICYLLALLGAHHFLHVSRIRVKSLTLRLKG